MTDQAKPKDTKETKDAPAKSRAGIGSLVAIVLPALLAGGAAYGGTRAAAAKLQGGGGHGHEAESAHRGEVRAPGPTMALEPFLVNVPDANKKNHPMKLTLAIEFDSTTKEEAIKPFLLRIRDAILAYMRTMNFEEATDSQHSDKLRNELLERCRSSGAYSAERVLITDLVSQ